MNKWAIKLVQEYVTNQLCLPATSWPDYWFRYRSYARKAAYDILCMLQANENSAKEVVENYMSIIDSFYEIKKDGIHGLMLNAAKETAEDILFIIEKESNDESIKKYEN